MKFEFDREWRAIVRGLSVFSPRCYLQALYEVCRAVIAEDKMRS